jgi:hypothetical protein
LLLWYSGEMINLHRILIAQRDSLYWTIQRWYDNLGVQEDESPAALAADAIHQNLIAPSSSAPEIRHLFQRPDFLQIPYRSHQLCFFQQYTKESPDHPIQPKELAIPFQKDECTVRKDLQQGPQEPSPLGRHAALTPEVVSSLVAMLMDAFHEYKAMALKEFLRTVQGRHNSALSKGRVRAFIGPHLHELKVGRSLPQEDLQMAVPRLYLEEHIALLKIHLTGKDAGLVFNLDEVGSADWEDWKTKKVIEHAEVRREDVYHPVSGHHRQATLLASVSALGDSLTPRITTAAPIPDTLWSRGLRQDENTMIRHRSPAYIAELGMTLFGCH